MIPRYSQVDSFVTHSGESLIQRALWGGEICGLTAPFRLKGLSVAKNYEAMSSAIFDANRDVYLKHFNPRNFPLVRWKWEMAFGAWKAVSRLKARVRRYRRVRPL